MHFFMSKLRKTEEAKLKIAKLPGQLETFCMGLIISSRKFFNGRWSIITQNRLLHH